MKVLQLDSSILGEASVSRQLSQSVVERLRENNPGVQVVHRDLGKEPLSHLTPEILAIRGTAAELLSELQNREARLDEALIAELKSADVLVIVATSGGSYADSPVDQMHVGYVKQVLNLCFSTLKSYA